MVLELESGFEILRLSDVSFDEMTVEIQYKGEQVAQLNKDQGIHSVEIELLTTYTDSIVKLKFLLRDFLVALDEAQKILEEA